MKDKILVNLIHHFSAKQIFFAVWIVVVAVFVWLIMQFYKSRNRRNFREDNFPETGGHRSSLPVKAPPKDLK